MNLFFIYSFSALLLPAGMMNLLKISSYRSTRWPFWIEKNLFFLGIYTGTYNSFLAAAVFHFQFSIWEEKLSKRIPSFINLKTRFFERFIESVINTKKLQKAGQKINNPLCRYIPRGRPPPEG